MQKLLPMEISVLLLINQVGYRTGDLKLAIFVIVALIQIEYLLCRNRDSNIYW